MYGNPIISNAKKIKIESNLNIRKALRNGLIRIIKLKNKNRIFEELYRHYAELVYKFAIKILKDKGLA